MPISPITLQRRHAELGRIRLGYQKPITKRDGSPGTTPVKLERFRFTSSSERYINDLATLYGGDARPWDNHGKPEFEVYSEANTIPVIAVKGGLSQWLEHWSGGGCQRRCDGVHEMIKDRDCICDPAERMCKPTTRLSVMLPELEALGVWRLESHGWNSAAEIPAVAELAQFVGDLVPAHLNLVERRSIKDGKTSRFVVPVLDLQIGTERLREIVEAKSGMTPELGSGDRPALAAGSAATDPFDPFFEKVAAAAVVDELAGIWDQAKTAGLVGTGATSTPRAEEFLAAWKAKAHQLKPDGEPTANEDGTYDAVIVDEGANEDALWHQCIASGADRGLDTDQVVDDFKQRMGGLLPDDASAQEMQHYLGLLSAESAA